MGNQNLKVRKNEAAQIKNLEERLCEQIWKITLLLNMFCHCCSGRFASCNDAASVCAMAPSANACLMAEAAIRSTQISETQTLSIPAPPSNQQQAGMNAQIT